MPLPAIPVHLRPRYRAGGRSAQRRFSKRRLDFPLPPSPLGRTSVTAEADGTLTIFEATPPQPRSTGAGAAQQPNAPRAQKRRHNVYQGRKSKAANYRHGEHLVSDQCVFRASRSLISRVVDDRRVRPQEVVNA
ncbi:hypothetical protein C8Q76DRAFT_727692 [Earliella scabrosa]|nr:hypothetical protein C8Q76DRAFT_727692 [Earliella scabrosa]